MRGESTLLESGRNLRQKTGEMIRRSHNLVSASREQVQRIEREYQTTRELLETMFEVRGSIDENRRGLKRELQRADR